MQIIDGKKISRKILAQVKARVDMLSLRPVFCDVMVGDDPASLQYVQMKKRLAEKVGVRFHQAHFPSSITTDQLVKKINLLNNVQNMCGIIVQLPLPSHLDKRAILDSIDPNLDVDCLGEIASTKFYQGTSDRELNLGFPTALACMFLLDSLQLDLSDKKIVVLGQGELVGRPVSALLRQRGFFPINITNKSVNKEEVIKSADVIISGIGQGQYITGDMIKAGAVVIDAGTSESNGGIVGDVDLESVKKVASFISPVPGGVGPVTVAMLLHNVLQVAKHLR